MHRISRTRWPSLKVAERLCRDHARSPASGQVVAIQVHHLGPRSHEILDKRLLRVVTRIDFGECPKLRVGTEDKVDTGTGPLDFACRAIPSLIHTVGCGGLPLRL